MVRGDKHMVLIPINPTGQPPALLPYICTNLDKCTHNTYVTEFEESDCCPLKVIFSLFQGPESQSHIYSRFIQVKHFNYFNWTLISKLFLPHMQSHNFSRFCAMIFTNLDLHFSALVSWYIPPKNLQFDGIISFPAHHQFWFWVHKSLFNEIDTF